MQLGCAQHKFQLCLLGGSGGAMGAHTHTGGLTMGLSKLCPVRAASVCAAEVLM